MFPLVSTTTLSWEAGTVMASDAVDAADDSCDSAGTWAIESTLRTLVCVFVRAAWLTVLARLRVVVVVDGGKGLRCSSESGIVVWPVRSL